MAARGRCCAAVARCQYRWRGALVLAAAPLVVRVVTAAVVRERRREALIFQHSPLAVVAGSQALDYH